MNAITSFLSCDGVVKCIDNMQGMPLYVGIAIAVVGVAVTFFSGLSLWYTAGFLILGGMVGLGLYYAKKAHLLEGLQTKVKQLQEIRENLETSNQELTKNMGSFRGENKKLTMNSDKLKKEVIRLNAQVTMMDGIITNATNVFGKISNASDDVKKTVQTMKEQVVESKKLVTNMAACLGKEIQEGIDKINSNLQEATFKNLLSVKNQYSEAKKELIETQVATQYETKALKNEREKLAQIRIKLQKTQEQLQKTEKTIMERIERLDRIDSIVDKYRSFNDRLDNTIKNLNNAVDKKENSEKNFVPKNTIPISQKKVDPIVVQSTKKVA